MPDVWEEQIPFYVAGTLTKAEAARLDRHFAACAECRRSLDEWQRIASAVRAEAASQLRGLPPLAPRVIATANRQAVGRYGYAPSPIRRPSRAATTSLTLMAAVFTVVLFGGLLAFLVLNSSLLQRQADENQVALLPSTTPTTVQVTAGEAPQIIVIEPSATPVVPTLATPTLEFVVVPTVQKQPTRAPQVILPPTLAPTQSPMGMGGGGSDVAPFSLMQTATCTAHVALANGIADLYAEPDESSAVLTSAAQADDLTALAFRADGWLQVSDPAGSKPLVGWVRQELVYLSGSCDSLPQIDAPSGTTPTATVLPFPTFSPTPATISAGRWTETRAVTTNGCAAADADSTTQLPISLTANDSTINATYGTDGTILMLARMSDNSFSGSTSTSQGILTLTLTFNTSASYSGEEVVTHTNGCVVHSNVSGELAR